MSVAVIERKEELYVITIVGDRRPVVKTYYTQRAFGNTFRGRSLDLIVLKNVELTEEAKREILPCLRGIGKMLVVGKGIEEVPL